MTTAEMLARVRTYLEESTEGFWKDTEIYSALTDGQYDILKNGLSVFQQTGVMPFVIANQVVEFSGVNVTAGFYAPQSDELWTITLLYAEVTGETSVPCRLYDVTREYDVDVTNTYLQGVKSDPLATKKKVGSSFGWYFQPSSAGFDVTSKYIKKPVNISASNEPELPETAHDAIVQYAYASILRKNTDDFNANSLAKAEYQKYLTMLQSVLGRS